jgi:hypothetical protein
VAAGDLKRVGRFCETAFRMNVLIIKLGAELRNYHRWRYSAGLAETDRAREEAAVTVTAIRIGA